MTVESVALFCEDAAPVESVFQRLRGNGPVVWAEAGARWCVLAPLEGCHASTPSVRPAYFDAVSGGTVDCLSFAAPGGPGWWGYLSYEGGIWFERMPLPDDEAPIAGRELRLPTAYFGRAEATATFDRRDRRWIVQGRAGPAHRLREEITRASALPPPSPPTARRVYATSAEHYLSGVRAVVEHLRAGDCYQVNLARRMDYVGVGDAFDLWRRLSALNPARRGFFLDTGEGAVVSNSPELLLSARIVGDRTRIRSVPIKGTAPRGGAGDADAALALLHSAKERAELTMIVDLVRADLGAIAVPGSVRCGRRRVGAVGHVLHAVRAVEADLPPGVDARAALARLFPAGSITGAPRVRAMEIIRALEDGPRGVYCGSMGWFGDDGRAHWNVGIRTVAVRDDRARLHVGAGLVIGSVPERELAETELKAARMAAALEGT